MGISKKHLLLIISLIAAPCFSNDYWSNYRFLIPDFEYRWAYSETLDNDQVTIIDKDGEITICQVMENGVIVCL